jgi:hypothetical protein
MESWKLVVAGGLVALGGMGLGAMLFGAHPVEAQHARYSECIVGRQESFDVNNSGVLQAYSLDHAVLIPAGWEPIGGGGYPGFGAVGLCRP